MLFSQKPQYSDIAVKLYATKDGYGQNVCLASGFYLITVKHATDVSAYYIGVVYKTDDASPLVTAIANNKYSIVNSNKYGTLAFSYNSTGDYANTEVKAYRFVV